MLTKQEAIIRHFCEKHGYDFINDDGKSYVSSFRTYVVDYIVLDDSASANPVDSAYFFIELRTMVDTKTDEIIWVMALFFDISSNMLEFRHIPTISSFGYKSIFERLNYLYDGLR